MMDVFVIGSSQFPGVFLRMDGTGVTGFNAAGGGTVNCQLGAGPFEKIRIIPQEDGSVAIGSVQFPGVFLRMDGAGATGFSAAGAGTVNCQVNAGPFEKFRIVPQGDGSVAIESVQFSGVFLRMDAAGVTGFNAAGSGAVNCQFGAGPFEKFRIAPDQADSGIVGLLNVFQSSAEISGPVCPKGGHVTTVVNVVAAAGRITISAHAECVNSCVTDNLEPSIAIEVIDHNGSAVDSLALDIPTVPGRGGNAPTVRSAEANITIDRSFSVKELRVVVRNRSGGIPILNSIPWGAIVEIVGAVVKVAEAA